MNIERYQDNKNKRKNEFLLNLTIATSRNENAFQLHVVMLESIYCFYIYISILNL